MSALPFRGGRVRFAGGEDRYPNGKYAWRCAACGKVGPWQDGWGGYWSILDEDDGLYADNGRGYPVWCSPQCMAELRLTPALPDDIPVTRRKPQR